MLPSSGSICCADTWQTHRIPAQLAVEAASETVSECAKQGYRETTVVLDADGTTIVATLEERGKGEIAPLSKLPHVMFIGGGVVIKLGDETRKPQRASG